MDVVSIFLWLSELVFSSFLLSEGSERLAGFMGRRFLGRTVLSIVTTAPEIAIVAYAAQKSLYGVSLGSAVGSNILMISLGLAVMILVATTRLSRKPALSINVSGFKMDLFFLISSAILGVLLFMDGYSFVDGVTLLFVYAAYIYFSYKERTSEGGEVGFHETRVLQGVFLFIVGGIGIFIGAGPFVRCIESFSHELTVPSAVVAVVLSPIAGEMPEKISIMLIARKGGREAEISIGNIFGSKILNNTLLLSIMIFCSCLSFGLDKVIYSTNLLFFQSYWAAVLTIIASTLMFDRKLTLSDGLILTILYAVSVGLQLAFTQYFSFS